MPITPIDPPRPIAQPAIAPIPPPSLRKARDGPIRVVVWFRPELSLPEDEIVCAPPAVDALFGDGMAQRLLMTPETAWLARLMPGEVAAALDATSAGDEPDDVIRSTPFSHIYLLRLTGGLGVSHVCDVLGASANVRLVYPEPTLTIAAVPTQYKTNKVFDQEQAYLKPAEGVDAESAWKKGYTGSGIQAGVVDMEADFSGLPYTPRVVGGSTGASTHGRQTTGILGCPDNATIGIGAAPEVTLVFSGVTGVTTTGPTGPTTTAGLKEVTAAFVAMKTKGGLKAGDVVNASLGVNAGLDIKRPYPEYAALLAQEGTAGWPHHLVTEKVGTETRPSGVTTTMAIEFEPTLLKFVSDLVAMGVTVVEAAGNGLVALCKPKGGGKDPVWVVAKLGANLGGPWLPGQAKVPLAAFRRGLANKAPHSLDRAAAATFADGGGIAVAGGQLSAKSGGMIDNVQLNHGNRVDCYVNTPNGQTLGFIGKAGGGHIGGTSLCAPVIAGVAAVVQGIAKAQFKAPLRPAIVRALLSDPTLGTATVSGSPVGVMPDLKQLMAFLETPQGKRGQLLKDVQAKQQTSATRAKAASTAGSFAHDPYTTSTRSRGSGSWQPLALASESDLFAP